MTFTSVEEVIEWASIDVTAAVTTVAPRFESNATGADSLLREDAQVPKKFYGKDGRGRPDLLLAELPGGSSNKDRAENALNKLETVRNNLKSESTYRRRQRTTSWWESACLDAARRDYSSTWPANVTHSTSSAKGCELPKTTSAPFWT